MLDFGHQKALEAHESQLRAQVGVIQTPIFPIQDRFRRFRRFVSANLRFLGSHLTRDGCADETCRAKTQATQRRTSLRRPGWIGQSSAFRLQPSMELSRVNWE